MQKTVGSQFHGLYLLSLVFLLGVASCSPSKKTPTSADLPNTIGPAGGTVTFEDPQSPINGMTIDVPAGSYPGKSTFTISTRPSQGLESKKLHPITPLIHVDNGGALSGRIMKVTIPIQLPEGSFAMGVFVHKGGKLEPMPLVALSETSITVATRHFSEFLISAIKLLDLPDTIKTKFKPGRDDWQFPNRGSFISPKGHCAGQSITAAWYFYEKTQRGEKPLYGKFDNNGQEPATPGLWEDDSLGYRFASTVQKDMKFSTELRKTFNAMAGVSPPLVWNSFLYSMYVTNDPQYVAVHDTAPNGGGHALVAYAADVKSGILFVADPNYPGNTTRCIMFFNGVFLPYISGSNLEAILAGETRSYEKIIYSAKTAMIPWDKITARWKQFEAGSIGQDRFPLYRLVQETKGGGLENLHDGMKTDKETLKVDLLGYAAARFRVRVRQEDKQIAEGKKETLPLKMGGNRFGFLVEGKVKGKWRYVDFKYLTIERVSPEPEPDQGEKKPKPVYNGVITGVYYGEVQSKTRTRGKMLFVTDATGKYPLRTAYEILSEKTNDFGTVVETHFRFRRGMGSPGIPPGRRRVCVGSIPGEWVAKSNVVTVGLTGHSTVTLGTPPISP